MLENPGDDKSYVNYPAPDSNGERPQAMAWDEYERLVLSEWNELLAQDPDEPLVQSFLELHPAMVPGGSGDIGPGGNHGAELGALYSQPRLKGSGNEFEPDFMWVTRSSDLITPIVIEIEKPSKKWFNQNGDPMASFTQAQGQLNNWRAWFSREANSGIFRERFLHQDQFRHRKLQPHFVLIYGRHSEFQPEGGHKDYNSLLYKRSGLSRPDETFLSFDSLVPRFDHANSMTVKVRPNGLEAWAFSPVYQTDADTGEDAHLVHNVEEAMARSVMIAEHRKSYLLDRIRYWRDFELKRLSQGQRKGIRSLIRE